MNGIDAHSKFCLVLIDETGRIVATLGEEKAVKQLRRAMAQEVTAGGMTIKSGAFVVNRSPRQLHDHKFPLEPEGRRPDLWRSMFGVMSSSEWISPPALLGRLSTTHRDLSMNDLEKVLEYYRERGRLERSEDGDYRLAPFMISTGKDIEDRLDRIEAAIPTMLSAAEGYLMERPGSKLKVIDVEGSQEDLDRFFEHLRDWLQSYLLANPTSRGRHARIVITADEVKPPEASASENAHPASIERRKG